MPAPRMLVRVGDPWGAAAASLGRSALAEGLVRDEEMLAHATRSPAVLLGVGWFLVAYLDDRPAGCIELSPLGDHTGELRRTFVAGWARRRGVASRLLETIEERARTSGFLAIRLDARRDQAGTAAFYEAHGYRRVVRFGSPSVHPTHVCLAKLLLPPAGER